MQHKKILSIVVAGLFGTLVSGCNGGGSAPHQQEPVVV
ncbi:MAG: hypothetical protein QG673_2283 [Pseudomonadota bacterium]|nr:hypothetical protein [Pseudomonadota bacterium]